MLQNATCGAWLKRALVDPEHHLHVLFLHFHMLDERADNITPARPVCFIQTAFDLRCEL